MSQRLISLITLCACLGVAADLAAAEATAVLDRNRLTLGESFRVKVLVRNSAGKPLVQPPKVPGCRVELLTSGQTNVPATARPGPRRSPGGNLAPLIDAIGKLESDTQKTLQEHAANQGFSGTGIDQGTLDMLRATRQQALEALQRPNHTEHQTVFRITPERAGLLTLPSFMVEAGGRTYLTKPLEVTVAESTTTAAVPPPSPAPQSGDGPATATVKPPAPALPPPYAAAELLGVQSHPRAWWPWLASILLAPFVVLAGIIVFRSWQRRRLALAPRRQQRQAASAARRQLRCCLRAEAEPEALASALTAYVRSRCAIPPGELTPAEAARSLEAAGASTALAEQLSAVLDACSAARFTPGGVAGVETDLARDARDLVRQLDRMER